MSELGDGGGSGGSELGSSVDSQTFDQVKLTATKVTDAATAPTDSPDEDQLRMQIDDDPETVLWYYVNEDDTWWRSDYVSE